MAPVGAPGRGHPLQATHHSTAADETLARVVKSVIDNIELVERLCKASVPLREARRLHLRDYGVLIPHVFMAEVLKRIGQCLSSGTAHGLEAHGREVGDILECLERAMAEGDRETRNVVALSFARDSETELFFDELLPLLGPKTRAQISGR